MTCIVGIVEDGVIYIGGERGISSEDLILSSPVSKVAVRNDWIYGYAGTIGIGQLMDVINLPRAEGADFKTIKTKIVPALQVAIENYSRDHSDHDTQWLIGANHRLYEVSSADWGVIEVDYTSIGGGSGYALGSLYTSFMHRDAYSPETRIQLALHSAITLSPMCQGPVDIFSL